jgi:homoserine O-acetyltransferase
MVKANTVCIGIDSDGLFPVEEQKFMAEHIPGARYREITSAFGHDGFLLEWKQIKEIIEIEGLI